MPAVIMWITARRVARGVLGLGFPTCELGLTAQVPPPRDFQEDRLGDPTKCLSQGSRVNVNRGGDGIQGVRSAGRGPCREGQRLGTPGPHWRVPGLPTWAQILGGDGSLIVGKPGTPP